MSENNLYPINPSFAAKANIRSEKQYQEMLDYANSNYEEYWSDLARKNISWHKPFTKSLEQLNPPFFTWFADGILSIDIY